MKKSVRYSIIAIILVLLVGFIVIKLNSNKKEITAKVYHPDVNTAVIVQVDTVKSGSFDLSASFTGSFSPNREVTISSETSGKVIRVNVEEGSYISTGQLIAQLDDGVIQAQLQSAQASYDKASNVVTRYQQAASGVTRLQIDNAKADVLTAKAQIDQLKKQVRQHTIVAPFNGIITSRNFDLGTIVSPGMQMATLTDISLVKLEINVPEKSISQFRIGQSIDVTTDVYPGTAFQGKVDMVASKADASHNFLIKIIVTNNSTSLKSGMYGTVSFRNTASANALSIPRAALTGSSIKPQVYIVEDGTARLRDIQTGDGNETHIQVTGGLREGELVVSGGLVNLKEGTKVSVAK